MWVIFRPVVGLYRLIMEGTKELFIRILMGILIFLGYILLSLFIYAIVRRIMVPQKLHTLPVHLQYTPGCHSYKCPNPHADLILNDGIKLMSSGQYYKISLDMELPETAVNHEVGVFMVNLTFYTTDRQYLTSSSRPAMIRYKSSFLKTLSTVVFAVPMLLGYWEQKQVLELVLFESYYEPYGEGALSAEITIKHHSVQIYSSQLSIEANFSGFTYYLYQWPISMSFIVVISIFISLCTCTVMMWVSDVVTEFDQQRRAAMLRRRQLQGRQSNGGAHRRARQLRAQAEGGVVEETTTTGSEVSNDETLTGIEDIGSEMSRDQSTPPPSITPTEGSVTGSEASAGLDQVLSALRTVALNRQSDSLRQRPGVDQSTLRQRPGE